MSSKDFLDRMRKAGEKYSGGGGGGVIGRIKVEFGLHRYVAGHDFWSFWKPAADEAELVSVNEELVGRLQKAGCSDNPAFGVKVTIDKNVLGRDEPYKANLQEFIPAWQEDSFEMIMNYLEEANLPTSEWFWGRVQYKANPHFVKQGEAGKKETDQNGNPRFPSVRVPVEKFADEAAARASVTASDSSNVTSDDSKWSDLARKTFDGNMSALEKSEEEILAWVKNISEGKAMTGYELPSPLTPVTAKKQVAEIYGIETSDIDLMMPF
ncbi:MAG: hypothetical protein ACYTFW_23750 [Planctomycetota bacterium]|jgi:hypothetical protein